MKRLIFRKDKYHKDLIFSLVVLKNLVLCGKANPLSGDMILEELSKSVDNSVSRILGTALKTYRKNGDKKAFDLITDRINDKNGESFKQIIIKLDAINPMEIISSIEALQWALGRERITWALGQGSNKSNFLTLISTVSMFSVIINFAVVVIFMDTINLLTGLF